MKLSIIIPTIGRKSELKMLLDSIKQAALNFSYEIIIVDQNHGGYLEEIIDGYLEKLPIVHHNVTFKGLSKAKNYGAKIAKGDFISFPDDDCKVFLDTYEKAFKLLDEKKYDMVFGKCVDAEDNDSVLNFKNYEYELNSSNMLGGFVEATVVCKRQVFDNFLFDENMGAGEFFGAEEGFDWLCRILTTSNYTALYSPEIKFYHPQVILSKGDLAALNRVFKYTCGTAYLCHKHGFKLRFYKRLCLTWLASLIYKIIDQDKAEYYKLECLALRCGMILAKKSIRNV